jgi:lipid-binding SYLF domain-containing protein
VGRSAEAGTDIQLKASMYSYSMSRGVFAGASLEGSTVSNHSSANKLYWNEELTPSEMLTKEAKGTDIQVLLDELNRIVKEQDR